jgi:hypothetical protein
MAAIAGFGCGSTAASGLHQRSAHSRTLLAGAPRRPVCRPGRLQVANIASPAREPLTLPSVVPDNVLIDEVRSPSWSAWCRRTSNEIVA